MFITKQSAKLILYCSNLVHIGPEHGMDDTESNNNPIKQLFIAVIQIEFKYFIPSFQANRIHILKHD